MVRFRAREDFFSEEMRSAYTRGMLYAVRPGNIKLATELDKWLAAGKCELVREDEPAAAVQGRGSVKPRAGILERIKRLWQ